MTRPTPPKCGFCGKTQFQLQPLAIENCPKPFAAIVCGCCHAMLGLAESQSLQFNPLSAENEA